MAKGWLDNYGKQENYNNSKTSVPEGFEGEGYSMKGRNYSPAWGGQFQKGGYIKKKVNKTEKDLLKKYIDPVEERAFKRAKQQGINTGIHNGPLDAIRHSSSAAAMSSALPTWTNFIPGVAPLKIAATNAAGIAHEIGSPNSWKEHASDVYNNFIGSVVGALPISEKNQHDLLIKAQKYGVLSDMGNKTPLRKRPAAPQLAVPKLPPFQMGGSVYPVNYVPQAQNGKLTFLQPTSDKLPQGYRIPYADPSSELAMSIGGENGEPAYLIPSFKYGKPLYNAIEEFKKTGEHLGGPFKTWQEADKWEQEVRHPYVEKGQAIPMPIKTWGEMAMGGSIPGAVGFSYARTQSPAPSNGPYAKKTKASAKDGEVIKDDLGQWAHPGEITEIGSNNITMEGVPYDVLGISDEGDTKLMKPGKNYKFKGKKVTEYPMAKNGLRQEQKGLQNLDNLTNFTNYNKPQPGGWLNKYN